MNTRALLKRGMRSAIHAAGGIEASAALLGKSGSQVGRWNSRTDADLPTLADAHAIDEAALIQSGAAPLLQAQARALGHVAILLPEIDAAHCPEAQALAGATAEFGDVARELVMALADGVLDPGERTLVGAQIHETIAALLALAALVEPDAVRPVAAGQTGEG